MEQRAVELDAGAEEIEFVEVLKMQIVIPAFMDSKKIFRSDTDHGYSSIRVPFYKGEITVFVDRTKDGFYRLKTESGRPKVVRTTNFTDEWPELRELFELLAALCAK